jgi:ribosomal protein L5
VKISEGSQESKMVVNMGHGEKQLDKKSYASYLDALYNCGIQCTGVVLVEATLKPWMIKSLFRRDSFQGIFI